MQKWPAIPTTLHQKQLHKLVFILFKTMRSVQRVLLAIKKEEIRKLPPFTCFFLHRMKEPMYPCLYHKRVSSGDTSLAKQAIKVKFILFPGCRGMPRCFLFGLVFQPEYLFFLRIRAYQSSFSWSRLFYSLLLIKAVLPVLFRIVRY